MENALLFSEMETVQLIRVTDALINQMENDCLDGWGATGLAFEKGRFFAIGQSNPYLSEGFPKKWPIDPKMGENH